MLTGKRTLGIASADVLMELLARQVPGRLLARELFVIPFTERVLNSLTGTRASSMASPPPDASSAKNYAG